VRTWVCVYVCGVCYGLCKCMGCYRAHLEIASAEVQLHCERYLNSRVCTNSENASLEVALPGTVRVFTMT